MGRIFEKRKERMFARWSKTSKAFTKIGKEIAIAVKLGGGDPGGNPRLRMAIQTARSLNMPKDRIEGALKRAISKDSTDFEEVVYEGYGPHGVAVLVESATDNKTRTVANVRSTFNRWGGTMATAGALDFVFERKGIFKTGMPKGNIDEFELDLIDHGLEELFETDDGLLLYCSFNSFLGLQRVIEDSDIELISAGLQRIPLSYVEVNAAQEADLEKLIGALEEDDDVQHVYANLKSEDE